MATGRSLACWTCWTCPGRFSRFFKRVQLLPDLPAACQSHKLEPVQRSIATNTQELSWETLGCRIWQPNVCDTSLEGLGVKLVQFNEFL